MSPWSPAATSPLAKLPTTPDDQSRAVIEGIGLALEQAGLDAGSVTHLGHGTTAATNALLERRGARTALVTTKGFGDLLWLGRQARPHLYRPEVAPPRPLAELAVELDERMSPRGPAAAARPGLRAAGGPPPAPGVGARPSPSACFTPTPTTATSGGRPSCCGPGWATCR